MSIELADTVQSFFNWTHEAGSLGIGIFSLIFIVATLIFVPAPPLTAIAAFGQDDLVAQGCEALRDPHFPLHA